MARSDRKCIGIHTYTSCAFVYLVLVNRFYVKMMCSNVLIYHWFTYVFWHDITKVRLTFIYTSNVVALHCFFDWRVFLDAQSHALLNCKELEVLSASWIPGNLVNGHTLCNFSRLTLLPRLWLQGKTITRNSNTLKVKINGINCSKR